MTSNNNLQDAINRVMASKKVYEQSTKLARIITDGLSDHHRYIKRKGLEKPWLEKNPTFMLRTHAELLPLSLSGGL